MRFTTIAGVQTSQAATSVRHDYFDAARATRPFYLTMLIFFVTTREPAATRQK